MNRPALPIVIALVPLLLLFAAVLRKTGMNFTYTLDDPYIHLALAKNLLQGHYGINLGEPSAPSSSILWPFLLTPFAGLSLLYFEYVPLLINVVCAILSAVLLDRIFHGQRALIRAAIVFSIMLATNLFGLVFTGMEHSLQVLLVIYLAYGLLERRVVETPGSQRQLFYASLFLLPLVRYEGMAFSLPILAYLFLHAGQRRAATIVLAALVAAIAGFSLYLHSKGLGYLPSSVLAKSYYGSGFAVVENLRSNGLKYGFLLLPIALIAVRRFSEDKLLGPLLLAITALHFVFGKYGWFGRYEVYFVIFIVVLTVRELLAIAPRVWWLVFSLPLIFNGLVFSTVFTPLGAANIANQQRQMALIARELGARVAVNDLGLVALESSQYVLDLWGLGSIEALKARLENDVDPSWIRGLMERANVEYAIVYPNHFPVVPGNWIRVADLKLNLPAVTTASDQVAFFATSDAAAARLRATLEQFSATHRAPGYSLTLR